MQVRVEFTATVQNLSRDFWQAVKLELNWHVSLHTPQSVTVGSEVELYRLSITIGFLTDL